METSRPAGRTSEESAAASTGPLRPINLLTSRCDHPGASTSFKRDDTGLVSSALAMRHRPASLRVEDLGLPPSVVERFGERGVKTTYAWQRGAIDSASDGSNLVFCAPTSGGKSLVAEVLLVKALMRRGRQGRALFVLPFHSLVNEKAKDLEKILAPMYRKRTPGDGRSPVAVRAFAGETEGAPLARPLGCPGQNEIVAVTTIEKASVTISRLAEEGRLGELCAVVVDELHLVGEQGRGGILESMLAKLRFADRRGALRETGGGPQIVAMSATVSHESLERLAGWLDARLFITNYRPVELKEHVVNHGGEIFLKRARGKDDKENDGPGKRGPPGPFEGLFEKKERDVPLHLVRATEIKSGADQTAGALAAETAVRGHSCLIFCPSRKRTRTLAVQLARAFETIVPSPRREAASARDGLARALAYAAEGRPDRDLVECCRRGVAFHHAHLSKREKDLVEDAFRRGTLHTLTCTTTLAAGVNLPARRVVILEGNYGNSASTYRQMAGRAGRAGQSDVGESFVIPAWGKGAGDKIATDTAAAAAFATVVSRLPALRSQLLPPGDGDDEVNEAVAGLVLQCIAAGTLRTIKDGFDLLMSTFAWSVPSHRPRLTAALKAALEHLRDLGHVETRWVDKNPGGPGTTTRSGRHAEWAPTLAGRASHRSALPLSHAVALHRDLQSVVREGLLLHSPTVPERTFGRLHLLFLCVPRGGAAGGSRGRNPFERLRWDEWYGVLDRNQAIGELGDRLGATRAFAMRMVRAGRGHCGAEREAHSRLAAAAALGDVIEGRACAADLAEAWNPVSDGAEIGAGTLQQLQADACTNAAMAANMSREAGWDALATLLEGLSKELDGGAVRELAGLMEVARDGVFGFAMTAARARALYKAGIRSPEEAAAASEDDVAAALLRAGGGARGGGTSSGSMALSDVFNDAKRAMTRRAARDIVVACVAHERRRLEAIVSENRENRQPSEIPDGKDGDD